MKVKFVPSAILTEEDKRQVAEMTGKIMFWLLEGRHTAYMAEQLDMSPTHVEANIDQMLYDFRKSVGWWRYFKILFIK